MHVHICGCGNPNLKKIPEWILHAYVESSSSSQYKLYREIDREGDKVTTIKDRRKKKTCVNILKLVAGVLSVGEQASCMMNHGGWRIPC